MRIFETCFHCRRVSFAHVLQAVVHGHDGTRMSSAADLPAGLEALLEAVELAASKRESGPITYDVADRMGALHACDVCARPIVKIDVLVARVMAHYARGNELARRLREALLRSPLESGDNLSPNYCSYHAQISSE
jgi:hypothetical protein